MRKFEKNEIKVGLFITVPIVIMFIIMMFKLGYSFAFSTIDVYLKIDSLVSIKKGTVVMIKGYQIGKVVELTPVYKPELHFLATMRIRKDIELYENSTVIIQNQNVIGDPSIEINNPEIRGGLLKEKDVLEGIEYSGLNAILQDVHKLLGVLTDTAGDVNSILGDSGASIKDLIVNLSHTAGGLNYMLQSSQKDMLKMLEELRAAAENMNKISVDIQKNPMKYLFKGSQ
jgi:ABC-type transporter Mla subunit MlaD